MSSSVEQIKDRLTIADVIGAYIKLEKAGSNFKAKCPFHNEKTPSFFISTNRNTYYCFGCGVKGDIFSFVQAIDGTDFMGALKTLADKAGVTLTKENPKLRSERERIYEVMEVTAKWFEGNLSGNDEALTYLKGRGLSEASIATWRIGFAPREWRALHTHLTARGFTQIEMEKAGLVKRSDDGKTCYDRFRGRIQFPIFDSAGRVVAFSGRIFGADTENEPKYLNSPETEVFIKSRILYGFHKAKEGIRKFGYSILVEGQMDLVMCHQTGFANTIATSGTAMSIDQLDMVRRISPNIVLAYDGDAAGLKAALRTTKIALSRDMEVKIAVFPEGVDPADLAQKSLDELKVVIKSSKHAIEFFLALVMKQSSDRRIIAKKVVTDIIPLIALLDSAVNRSHYIGIVAKQSGIREEALSQDVVKVSRESVLQGLNTVSQNEVVVQKGAGIQLDRLGTLERKLLCIVLWQQTLKPPSKDPDKLLRSWDDLSGSGRGKSVIEVLTDDQKNELIFEAEAYYDSSRNLEEEIDRLLEELRIEYLKHELDGLIRNIHEAEESKDHVKALALLKRSQDVSKMINEARMPHKKQN
jgi:DNA primase